MQFFYLCARGGFDLRLPAPASLRRDGSLTQGLATVTMSRGGFDESTPTQGSAMAPTPQRALRSPPPGHKRSDRGLRCATQSPRTRSGGYSRTRPPSYCPSNFPLTFLFAHNFSFNYYKTINKDIQSPSCCPSSASLPPRQLAGFRCVFSPFPRLPPWATEGIAPCGAKIVPAAAAFDRSSVASRPPWVCDCR